MCTRLAPRLNPDTLPAAERGAYQNGFEAGQDSMKATVEELKKQLQQWQRVDERDRAFRDANRINI